MIEDRLSVAEMQSAKSICRMSFGVSIDVPKVIIGAATYRALVLSWKALSSIS